MRVLALLTLLPLAFSITSPLLASRTAPDLSTQLEVFTNNLNAAAKFKCENYATRKNNCQCRDGLIKPPGYRKYGMQPADNCQCGDKKNSVEYKDNKGILRCKCPGVDQYYNYDTNMCDCQTSCKEVRVHDKLTCVRNPPYPTPTHKMGQGGNGKAISRSLKAALVKRQTDAASRDAEIALGCLQSEKACQNGDQWTCVEVMSSLMTCGGCAGEAIDCSALSGASEVHCSQGRCVIDSCARGYKLTVPSSINGTTTQPATCEPIRRHGGSTWFAVQGDHA